MPVQPAALDLLSALAPILSRWGRWYVFGAAVIVYGVPRLSADVDVTLALTPDAPDRFADDMRKGGFALRVDDPEFLRRTRVMPFVHLPTGRPLDVVLANSGLEDDFLDRSGRQRSPSTPVCWTIPRAVCPGGMPGLRRESPDRRAPGADPISSRSSRRCRAMIEVCSSRCSGVLFA